MSLPNTIDKSSPAGTDAASGGAAQIRSLKEFLEDILGIPNSTLMTNKAFKISANGEVARQREPIVVKTSNYTLTIDDEIILCSGTWTLTLPTASTVPGKVWKLKKSDAGVITLAGVIDGVTNPIVLTGIYSTQIIFCDGTNYYKLLLPYEPSIDGVSYGGVFAIYSMPNHAWVPAAGTYSILSSSAIAGDQTLQIYRDGVWNNITSGSVSSPGFILGTFFTDGVNIRVLAHTSSNRGSYYMKW